MNTKKVWRFVATVLVVVFLTGGVVQTKSVSSQSPASKDAVTASPMGGRIAFVSGLQIYVINADGSGETRLSNPGNYDIHPSWSPDGSKIAFVSFGGNYEIYVMNADGSGQTNLTNNAAWDGDFAWSPDGSKIAFVSGRSGNNEIYVMGADGSGQRRLTDHPPFPSMNPSWSPDGNKIAFAVGGPNWINTINVDGSAEETLTLGPGNGNNHPSWSPDGSKIAFVSSWIYEVGYGATIICVMNADGSSRVCLDVGDSWDPAWSPNSRQIAFIHGCRFGGQGCGSGDIYVMNADLSSQTNLTNNGGVGNGVPTWSPDGSKIAFVHDDIHIVNPDGLGLVELGNNAPVEAVWGLSWGSGRVSLDLPVSYSNFAQSAQGNIEGRGPGRVNSWLDHQYPTYGNPPNSGYPGLLRWDGRFFANPTKIGEGWYDGHSGIDFQHLAALTNEPVFSAAPGVVARVVTGCQEGNSSCGGSYGNQVWVNHRNGYATLYGHLKTVSASPGQEISSPSSQSLGVMGNTGNSTGTHLHFGVYYDQNSDGQWTENEVVDPYGWRGANADPWTPASIYLWKYDIWSKVLVGSGGASLTSPSGGVSALVPPGAFTSTLTLELWDAPVANPSASLRSLGHSFWLRVLEWLIGSSATRVSSSAAVPSFSQPVTLTVTYGMTETRHLDTAQLALYQWDESGGNWSALPSVTDSGQQQVTAQTTETGEFDLQAPLLCPADSTEPDDHYDAASTLSTDGTPTSRLFDIADDEDWFRFVAAAGKTYEASTSSLGAGVDTIIELYDLDGITLLVSDDNSGGGLASGLRWRAPLDGTYFLRVRPAPGSSSGCNATYQLSLVEKAQNKVYLPIILR